MICSSILHRYGEDGDHDLWTDHCRTRARLPDRLWATRVRGPRTARGLTQTELAGDRFSKEYVSQIERGKTRPTLPDTRVARRTAQVDRAVPRDRRLGARASSRRDCDRPGRGRDEPTATRRPSLPRRPRVPSAELQRPRAPRRVVGADVPRRGAHGARAVERRARPSSSLGSAMSTAPRSSTGWAAAATSSRPISTALSLFTEALKLADASGLPCDRLRAHMLEWRSRCYRRQRDYEAAREDIERALELAEGPRRHRDGRARLLPGVARRRAPGPVGPRPLLRRTGEGDLRGDRRPPERRPAAEQPRRADVHARQAA